MFWDPINRRHLLQGLGGFTLAVPVLPSLLCETALAQGATGKSQFFIAFVGDNGEMAQHFYPAAYAATGVATLATNKLAANIADCQLSSINGPLSPIFGTSFDPFRSKMLLVSGLDRQSDQAGHHAASALGAADTATGPTIDWYMSQSAAVYPTTPVARSLNLVFSNDNAGQSTETNSFGPSGAGNPAIYRPSVLFNQLFANVSPSAQQALLAKRKSVLDWVLGDVKNVQGSSRLSAADKAVLDRHLTGLRDLEAQIQAAAALTSGCSKPAAPPDDSYLDDYPIDETLRQGVPALFNGLVAAAIACGMTKVVTISFNHTTDNFSYAWVPGVNGTDHHTNSHNLGTPDAANTLGIIKTWLGAQVADLLGRLNVDNGMGTGQTYLDTGIVTWLNTSGVSGRDPHPAFCMPVAVWGSANGQFNTGRFISYESTVQTGFGSGAGRFYNGMLVNFMTAMGLASADWGGTAADPGFGVYGAPVYAPSGYTYPTDGYGQLPNVFT